MAIMESTFLKYQEIYLDFISKRAVTGCTQAEYCRQFGISPMTLSRVLSADRHKRADFTRPFSGTQKLPDLSQVQKSTRKHFTPDKVEFVEVKIW